MWDLGAGRRAGGRRGSSPGTRGPGGGLGEARGRQGKESRDQGTGRRAGGGSGRQEGYSQF